MAESSVIRFIDELKSTSGDAICAQIKNIRESLKYYKKQEKTFENINIISSLYATIDELQFIPEYVCLIIDKDSDYRKACNGFVLNGLEYKRLLGTPGGIKNNTIVFMAEKSTDGRVIRDEINRRLDNGRDLTKELVPAKFEAYKALACSASIPVSTPNGIIVVNDCVTKFRSNYILLDDEQDGEPILTEIKNGDVELIDSDGYGIISPALAERWSQELGEEIILSGFCIRNAFCKGMVFPFNYVDFGENIAGGYIITDAWGVQRDVRNAELILTTSMLKLWDSYKGIEEYIENCEKNHYPFSVTKICEPNERNSRELNYQFIQSYDLTDNELEELIQPTLEDINGVLGGDFYKTILFLKGSKQNKDVINSYENDYAKALMINPDVINDPHLRDRVSQMIQKRIDNAKLGRIRVGGDFSVISGDPYSLCQSMFGLVVTGLLKSGQVYSQYWNKRSVSEVVCFRAPMSCHNNIRKVNVYHDDRTDYWYKYMENVLILNSWDMITHACNGADKDGDSFLTTDNPILIKNTLNSPAIVCIQRKAAKKIVCEDDLIQSNISSFGDEIGSITNKITAMFEVRSKFSPDSEEYANLNYRIMCGQLYQQNAIDRIKGIVTKPMPEYWYNERGSVEQDKLNDNSMNVSIVAAKKPYFMIFRYSQLKYEYMNFLKNSFLDSLSSFDISIEDLFLKDELSQAEATFITNYYKNIPVGIGDCIMNRLSNLISNKTKEQKNYWRSEIKKFDYSIYKSGVEYSKHQMTEIQKAYAEYHKKWRNLIDESNRRHMDLQNMTLQKADILKAFKEKCDLICDDELELCEILLDITYGTGRGNQIVWDICGKPIISNLLQKSGSQSVYLELNDDGEVDYCGDMFMVQNLMEGEIA